MNNENYHLLLYQRVKEIQPHLIELTRGYIENGMTPEEINTEICFAIMNEGYRLRCLEQEIILKPNERKLQTHIDTNENDLQNTNGKDNTG